MYCVKYTPVHSSYVLLLVHHVNQLIKDGFEVNIRTADYSSILMQVEVTSHSTLTQRNEERKKSLHN